MDIKQYGVDTNGVKQGSLTPLSKIKFNDINVPFAELLNQELRKMKRENRQAKEQGVEYIVDELTIEAADELSLMIAHATANERGMPIKPTKKFDAGLPSCTGCGNNVKLYRSGLCRPCYAGRLGWSNVRGK